MGSDHGERIRPITIVHPLWKIMGSKHYVQVDTFEKTKLLVGIAKKRLLHNHVNLQDQKKTLLKSMKNGCILSHNENNVQGPFIACKPS
jgi:hypothetical protein